MTWQKLRKLLHTRRVAVRLLRAETEHDVVSWRTATKTAAGLATCRFTAR